MSASKHVPETRRGQDVSDKITVDSIHPHRLIANAGSATYRCSGCQELGFGHSYRCKNTDCRSNNNGKSFVLHEACVDAGAKSNSSVRHKFLGDNKDLRFLKKPPGYPRLCHACRKEVHGFVYHRDDTTGHVDDTGSGLHPCCFHLNDIVPFENQGMKMTLKLRSAIPSKCSKCKKQRVKGSGDSKVKGWSYESSDGKYCYHVACLRELVIEQWKKGVISQDIMVKRIKLLPATRKELVPQQQSSKDQGSGNTVVAVDKMVWMVVAFLVFFVWLNMLQATTSYKRWLIPLLLLLITFVV